MEELAQPAEPREHSALDRPDRNPEPVGELVEPEPSEPTELAKWWGPEGFTIPDVEFDPRVGATYRIEMQPPEGEAFYLTGEFRDVDPPTRLAFTFIWDPPDPEDVETLVGLSFADLDGSTEVAFTQGAFKTEARRALHRQGWMESFGKLERLISTQ